MESSTTFIKRAGMIASAVVLACALAVTMAACGGPSSEEVIRTGVTEEFEGIKNLDQEALDQMLDGAGSAVAELEQYGITAEDFCRAWLEGFDYTLDDVTVDGDNATVKVTVTCRSLMDGMSVWLDRIGEMAEDPAMLEMGEDELNQKIGPMLVDALGQASTQTTSVELPYVLNGNTWEPGAGYDTALADAFGAGSL